MKVVRKLASLVRHDPHRILRAEGPRKRIRGENTSRNRSFASRQVGNLGFITTSTTVTNTYKATFLLFIQETFDLNDLISDRGHILQPWDQNSNTESFVGYLYEKRETDI